MGYVAELEMLDLYPLSRVAHLVYVRLHLIQVTVKLLFVLLVSELNLFQTLCKFRSLLLLAPCKFVMLAAFLELIVKSGSQLLEMALNFFKLRLCIGHLFLNAFSPICGELKHSRLCLSNFDVVEQVQKHLFEHHEVELCRYYLLIRLGHELTIFQWVFLCLSLQASLARATVTAACLSLLHEETGLLLVCHI